MIKDSKILFVLPRFHTNQIGIINYFIKNNNEVNIHVANKGFIESYELIQPYIHRSESSFSYLRKKIFKGPNRPDYCPELFSYLKLLRKLNPDLVFVRQHCPIWTNIILIASIFLRFKVILIAQILPYELKHSHKKNCLGFLKKIIFYFRLYIFRAFWTTPLRNQYDSVGILPRRSFYLPFVLPKNKIREKYKEHKFKILSIGKYVERKKQDLLIMAVKKVSEEIDTSISLDIVGEYHDKNKRYFKYLKDLSKDKRSNLEINLIKNVSFEMIQSYYQRANLFVLPSVNEPASISILEALSWGVISICSDQCGTKGYIDNSYSGYIFPANDLNRLSELIIHSIKKNDKTSRKEISRRLARLTDENVFENYLSNIIKKF